MVQNILKRIAQTVLVLFCVALLIFVLLRIVPGNAVVTMMGEHADTDAIARMTAELGLDQPVYVQFWKYISGAVTGNLGTSYSLNRSVSSLMAAAFPHTLILALLAAAVAWTVGILCGVGAAVKKNGAADRLFMGFSLLGVSMPVFIVRNEAFGDLAYATQNEGLGRVLRLKTSVASLVPTCVTAGNSTH